ncbi:MAG: Gfo/Idh/MocA family oxidoreductase [Methanomicrobia archaeon]|nr:Gfo/Idh/MocA family oxidoreductase [Methanomicrobia archaeon]
MKKERQIAVLGAGNVANGMHLPAWRNIKAEVVAVCDTNRASAERTAKNWKIPRVYTDFDELLEVEKGAIIDICTPPVTHAPLSIKAMEAGFNVVLEKPMTMSIEESAEILTEYHKKREEIQLCVIHNYLFSHSMLKIKSILEKKRVEILDVNISMLHTLTDEMISDKNHWVHSLPRGRFGECLIHPVYLLRNLLGELTIRDVWSAKRGPYDWVQYDELHATFNSNEKIGSIYISFNSPRESSFPLMNIYGKNAIINFDGTNSTLTVQGRLNTSARTGRIADAFKVSSQTIGSTTKNAFNVLRGKWKSGHENLFRFFVDSISEDKEMPYTPEEAFEANRTFLEVLEKIGKTA